MNKKEFSLFLGTAITIVTCANVHNVENYINAKGCRIISIEYGAMQRKIGLAVCERSRALFIQDYFERKKE